LRGGFIAVKRSKKIGLPGALSNASIADIPALTVVIASALKQLELILSSGGGSLASWLGLYSLSIFEALLGLWLVSKARWRIARAISVTVFVAFAAVALVQASIGHEDCGCFGSVRIHPWVTFSIDLTCVGLLLAADYDVTQTASRASRAILVSLCLCFVGVLIGIVILPSRSSAGLTRIGETVIASPRNWIGRYLPIMEYLKDGDCIRRGDWSLILYRDGCKSCQSVLADPYKYTTSGQSLAFIAIPPITSSSVDRFSRLELSLLDEFAWNIPTPMIVELRDGVVVDIRILQ
jgi:hypothetical protein